MRPGTVYYSNLGKGGQLHKTVAVKLHSGSQDKSLLHHGVICVLYVLLLDILLNKETPALPVEPVASSGTALDRIVGSSSRPSKMLPMHIR